MKFRYIAFFILSMACLQACNTDNPYLDAIIGDWDCEKWMVNGANYLEQGDKKVSFYFGDDNAFKAIMNGAEDIGTYRIKENKLYTKADNDDMEIMIKITKLEGDNMEFEMNRAGERETMILIKRK